MSQVMADSPVSPELCSPSESARTCSSPETSGESGDRGMLASIQKQTVATSRLLPHSSTTRSRKMLHPPCSKRTSSKHSASSGSSSSSGSACDSDMPMDLCIKREKSPVNADCSIKNTASAFESSSSSSLAVNIPQHYQDIYEKMTRPYQVASKALDSSMSSSREALRLKTLGFLPSLVVPEQVLASAAQFPPLFSSSQESVNSSQNSVSSQESPLPVGLDDDSSDLFTGRKVVYLFL